MLEARNATERDNNALQLLCLCCVQCLLSILGDILEYINCYVYVYIAKNHTNYIQSAKDVGNMLLNTGFLPLINDYVIAAPLFIGLLLLILTNVLIVLIFVQIISPLVIILASDLAIFIYLTMTTVITAYVKTCFVVWAEDREIFATDYPEYGQLLNQEANDRLN